MNARKFKRHRAAAYRAGPLAPWRSASFIVNEMRGKRKRAKERGLLSPNFVTHIGAIGFISGCVLYRSPAQRAVP